MAKTTVKNVETLAKTKFLSLYDVDYTNKAGQEKNWTVASRKPYDELYQQLVNNKEDKVDAVVILALHNETNKIVVVKQFRVPINDYVYELPAGLIDAGENIKSSLDRELREETGLEVVEVIENKGANKVYLSPGMTDESVALKYCTCKGEITKENLEDDEEIEPLLLSKEEASAILQSGAKFDVKCLMALNEFVRYGAELFK